ncbi:MAG TPA: GMC oxidoreductase [Amycolatopsis sp.]
MHSFDYIVVGGGTAGCVLAARLSEDARVLLLEAGPAEPLVAMADPLAWPRLAQSSVDWDLETVPQPGTGGEAHRWPRGKVLGGSGGIGGLTHVPGDRSAYDAWAVPGWDGAALEPYLTRAPAEVVPDREPLWEACFAAAMEAGHSAIWTNTTTVDGVRRSAADVYLAPDRPNLTVVTDACARRLVLDGTVCRGVEYRVGDRDETAFAEVEVVLAAGVVGSPLLLLRSGIGPGADLRAAGITVVANLPGVGANLQDPPRVAVSYSATRPVRATRFARTSHVLASDLLITFADVPVYPRSVRGLEDGYSVLVTLTAPASRGTVRLDGVDPGYLSEAADLDRLADGIRRARAIGTAAALEAVRDKEIVPGLPAQSDEALRAYVRQAVSTAHDSVGTCALGSVVDPALAVRGISGLRVADASVLPSPGSGQVNATVLAVAERAAELIRR